MKKTSEKTLNACCPELIQREWHHDYNNVLGLDPDKIMITCGKPAFWKCPVCGSIYIMAPRKRLECDERHKTSCFTCRGRVQLHPFIV